MEDEGRKMEDGRREMEDGKWKTEDGRWKMEDERRMKEDGKRKVEDDDRLHGYETADTVNYHLLKTFALENRKNQTCAERMLWEEIRTNRYNFKFRRQHVIGIFIADFVCLKYRLVIEVDGGYHHQSDQQVSDALRTKALNDEGFKVLRFTNEEVEADPKAIAEQIYDEIFNMEIDNQHTIE